MVNEILNLFDLKKAKLSQKNKTLIWLFDNTILLISGEL
jgi:hypothetical protein